MSEKEKLIALIEENETVQRYKKLEALLNKNMDVKRKINKLKAVQKQLINAKHINKQNTIDQYQATYDKLLKEIEDYPLMTEYLELQEDINQMLKDILSIIEDEINKEIENA